ncbi:predicted protein [Chaetoceros tenuissimus]|uniref:Uncharacterized protein n=1 Tax=Chaetoceros tenuissimus TaxID=426638 RepID=A0AAD3CS09_9STRA|nr:predicted protein [Chaetoceros tenuissimus]
MKFSTLLFAASAALLPTSFAIEGSAKKYLRSGALSAISPSDRSLGSLDDWCPDGFTDQLCIKSGKPGDSNNVEHHAAFEVVHNTNTGNYDWSIDFTDSAAIAQDLVGSDAVALKYAIIPSNEFSIDDTYFNYGGGCKFNQGDDSSCVTNVYQISEVNAWDSVDRIASGTLAPGETLVWYLHINLEVNGSSETSFALPCATATTVDPDLGTFGDQIGVLTLPSPHPSTLTFTDTTDGSSYDLTFVDPSDGEYHFDHVKRNSHGWGWNLYYTAPTDPCTTPPDDPEPPENPQPPQCKPDVVIDNFCTSNIEIFAGQHIPVGIVTLEMAYGVGEYLYTVTLSLLGEVPNAYLETNQESCSIKPYVEDGEEGICENVKTQSGDLSKPINKLPIGKYADKCCLPQEDMSAYDPILIAEGSVTYGNPSSFPLVVHLDLIIGCVEDDPEGGEENKFYYETGFAMGPPDGDCPFTGVELPVKHGWGMGIEIDTSTPTLTR